MLLPFEQVCQAAGLPAPVAEYRFAPPRRWRFDYAWPSCLVALEIEGGLWIGGRHVTGAGFSKDMEKYNEAARLGWRVYRVSSREYKDGAALALLQSLPWEELSQSGRE